MILDHVRVFTEDKKFTDGGIVIKDGRNPGWTGNVCDTGAY